jgi:flagellar basal body rod protein FlgB
MVEIKKAIKNGARNNKPVLVLGETGTGKELIVQSIHRQSKKSDCPLIKLNCAARPMQSIQAQIFAPKKPHSSNSALAAAGEKTIYLANIDTPGYTAQKLDFDASMERALQGAENPAVVTLSTEPGRSLDGNNVNLEGELGMLGENKMMYSVTAQILAAKFRQISSIVDQLQ